jgi:hypothetical protein
VAGVDPIVAHPRSSLIRAAAEPVGQPTGRAGARHVCRPATTRAAQVNKGKGGLATGSAFPRPGLLTQPYAASVTGRSAGDPGMLHRPTAFSSFESPAYRQGSEQHHLLRGSQQGAGSMKNVRPVKHLVQKALAFAHAALDDTTPRYVAEAMRYAEEVLPHVSSLKPPAALLGEAHELMTLVGQLRAVMKLLERKLEVQTRFSN